MIGKRQIGLIVLASVFVGGAVIDFVFMDAAAPKLHSDAASPSTTGATGNGLLAASGLSTDHTIVHSGNPLWAVAVKSLTAVQERPLFSASRRPKRVVQSMPVKQAPSPALIEPVRPPSLTLVGAIAGEGSGMAIFVEENTKDTIRLAIGEGHSGWILRKVEDREVTFQKDLNTAVFSLPHTTAK